MANLGNIFVVLTFIITKVSSNDEDIRPCLNLLEQQDEHDCCNGLGIFEKIFQPSEECPNTNSAELTCEEATCLLKEEGIIIDNKVDEEETRKFFMLLAKQYPKEMIPRDMIDLCLNGKYMEYEFATELENCPAMNLFLCIYVNLIVDCNSWKDTPNCTAIAEQGIQCKAYLEILKTT